MTWGQCEAWSFNPILHSQQNRLQSSYSPYMLFTPIHEWLYKSCGCFRCLESYLWSQHGVWSSYSTEWLNRCCTECMNATVSLPVSRVFKEKKRNFPCCLQPWGTCIMLILEAGCRGIYFQRLLCQLLSLWLDLICNLLWTKAKWIHVNGRCKECGQGEEGVAAAVTSRIR